MISISQLAYQMKTDDKKILDWINSNNEERAYSIIKIKNGKIKERDSIVIGLGIFLDITRWTVENYLKSYEYWKKKHKNNAQII